MKHLTQLEEKVPQGTPPLLIDSSTLVANLNADLLDGNHASAFATTDHIHTTFDRATSTLTGANVFSDLVVTDGIVTSISTRALAATDIGAAATSHAHGNITSAGAIGSTATLPIITTTSGVLTTGSFGTAAGTFAEGSHAHSTYDRASSVLSGANVFSNIVVTDGITTAISTRALTASDVGAAASSHTHGNITNAGAIGSTAGLIVKTTTSGVLTTLAAGSSGQFLQYDGTWAAVPNSYVHPTGDGNLHVPATSTTNDGKVLTAGATAGAISWTTPLSAQIVRW